MTAVDELQARREARESAQAGRDARRDMRQRSNRGREAEHQAAYEAGKRGERIPFDRDDEELHQSYLQGTVDAEAEEEAKAEQAKKGAGAKKGSSTRSVPSSRRRAPRVATKARQAVSVRSVRAVASGSPSFLQILGVSILLAGLYLVLTNAGKLTNVVNGARNALLWLIDPHATLGGKS